MDRTFVFGVGLALVSLFLQYAVKELPEVITYTGIALGAILMLASAPGINLGTPELVMLIGASIFAAGVYQLIDQKESQRASVPNLEGYKDSLRMDGPPLLKITTSADGSRMTSAQILLRLVNGGQRSLSYTVHQFRGEIEGVVMPDVEEPSHGGEILPGEPRTYNGATAKVDIGAGLFEGVAEWDIHYGIPVEEPFRFTRQVKFQGVYNPNTAQGENIVWIWQPPKRPPRDSD